MAADSSADDAARFLAGLTGAKGPTFADLQASPGWVGHQRTMQDLWRPMPDLLTRVHEFERAELRSPNVTGRTVFYPFSGPDVLFLTALFPSNPTYVMVGLEPPGTMPDRREIERKGVNRFLAGIRESVFSELHRSFFVTREMDRTFRGQVTDGVAAPILLLLALSGQRILSLRYVRLDEQGNVVERAADWKAPGRVSNKGIEVLFDGGAERPPQTLYYFSVNLADSRLRGNPAFFRFLDRLGTFATSLKATSYMPHRTEFALIREAILSRSSAVLQDDSGIPYRFFQDGHWKIQLYGTYDRPYGSFRYLQQPDLRAAFSQPGVKPLPFRIGYGFGKAPSKLTAGGPPAVIAPLQARACKSMRPGRRRGRPRPFTATTLRGAPPNGYARIVHRLKHDSNAPSLLLCRSPVRSLAVARL